MVVKLGSNRKYLSDGADDEACLDSGAVPGVYKAASDCSAHTPPSALVPQPKLDYCTETQARSLQCLSILWGLVANY
jgi:hypothetical protein